MSTRCASGVSTVHLALSWNESLRLNANRAASAGSWSGDSDAAVPVVLLPGTAETAQDWDEVATHVSEEFPVFAVDLRGHGRSDWPGTYSIELFAHDVCGALEQLQVGPVHLVGHSLGGLVACKVAAAVPDLVRTLVLEDVGMPHPRVAATPDRPEGPLAFDWAVVEQVRPEIDNPAPSWADVIARIDAPTLVIGGGPRSFVPQQHLAELVEQLADARLVTIDAGHLLHKHEPGKFIQNLLDFLAAHRAH